MSVCFGRDILQQQERRRNAGNSEPARVPALNVFFSRRTDSLRLELALLAMPVVAIAITLALLPQSDSSSTRSKVTLRVTSAAPPPNPELEREAQLRREQIRFALSKVANAQESKAGSEVTTATSSGSNGSRWLVHRTSAGQFAPARRHREALPNRQRPASGWPPHSNGRLQQPAPR